GAQIETVMTRGEPVWFEDALVPIVRNGRMEDVFWTYSYSPAYDDDGRINGTLVIVTEVTGRVLSGRRLFALATLSGRLSSARSSDDVLDIVDALAPDMRSDLPFVIALEPERMRHSGLANDDAEAVERIVRATTVTRAQTELTIDVPGVVCPEPIRTAIACSVGSTGHVLVFGISPRLPLDEGYRSFVAQITEHVASTLRRIDNANASLEIQRQLERADRAKDEFLAMLGHELRNPLAPIVTALELMNHKDTNTTRERAVIERQVRHVIRLVDDLMDVSRITRGLITLEQRVVDLADVVAAAIDANTHLIQQHDHRLVVETPRGITVRGDEARLVQIASNLLTNAARYTPPGGEIRVSLTSQDGGAVLRVADTGAGIDAMLLPKVFDLFVQGQRSADRSEGGLGLGLAIVRNLVMLHGGTVTAESAGPGLGSAFTIRLDLADDKQAAPVRPKAPAVTSKRVLVVDDNEDAANLLGEIARLRGHEVTIVHGPEAALELVGTFCPDVAVLDIGLPGMDGYELADRIRRIRPSCRLIALTGYGQGKDRERALEAGFAAHLVKPVRVNELLETIGRA
ncbi:MAG TPA: ATP-binding protein, partial [Kofleriaceae bacterium]|nr:ATP-binding protein [Kofleriaceae bacterium]